MSPPSPGEFHPEGLYPYDRSSPGRWFVSHVGRHWHFLAWVVVGSVIFISLRTSIPVLVGQAYEAITHPERGGSLWTIALWVVAAAVVQGLINLTTAWSNETVAQRIERDAREELLVSLLSKSQTFHDAQRVGDLMARATGDVKQLNLMVSPALNLLFQSLLSLIIPLVMMATIDVRLLLVPVLFALASAFSLRSYIATLGPLTGQMRAQNGELNAVLTETLANIKVVRNFVQEAREAQRFERACRRWAELFEAQGSAQARYTPLLWLGIAIGAGMLHALLLWKSAELELGEVVSYVGLLGVLRFPTFISLFAFSMLQAGLASAARLLETINSNTEIDQNAGGFIGPARGEIEFDHVDFAYQKGGPLVLKDIHFKVPAGARVAVVGPTGSGKTTLIKLLQRLYDVDRGRVTVDGVDVREWNLQALRGSVGVIEQDIFLFSRTIEANIAFGHVEATRAQIVEAATAAQAHGFITTLKEGYETQIGSRGTMLSGGQKQRVAIARALLSSPVILALDDATSAIDSATEDQIQRALKELMKGRTSLVITHRLAQIRHADLILVMKKGRIVAQGRHEQLIRTSPEYRDVFEVYGAQLPPLEPTPNIVEGPWQA